MASSFSTDLKLELMVTGENSGTWGDKTNSNLNLLQQAIAGYQAIALTSTNTTLAMTDATISDARNAVLKFTGTITANCTVFVASGIEKTYTIENGTSGAFTLALNQVGGASVIFGASDKTTKLVYLNGTDAVDLGFVNLTAPQTLTNKTLTAPTINSGTIGTATLTSPIINEIDDNAGNEFVIFSKTTTAVNEITISNATTGNAPNIAASGSDTDVNLNLTPKGVGKTVFNGTGKIQQLQEKVSIFTSTATGTIDYNLLDQAVVYYTGAATGQFTLNFRGSATTALNTILAVGDSMTAAFLNTNTSVPYYTTFTVIDGVSTNVITEWQGGSAPSSGNSDSIDVYSYTIIKTAASTYTVLAGQVQFK
jgi:hypothetical protein